MSESHPQQSRESAVDRATGKLVVSYLVVGVPLLYGLIQTAAKAAQLFGG